MNLDTLSNAALIVSSSASLVLSFISLLLAKRLFKKDAPVGQKRSQYVGAKVQEEKANEKICLIRKKDSLTNDELEKLIKLQENEMSNFRSELKKQNINIIVKTMKVARAEQREETTKKKSNLEKTPTSKTEALKTSAGKYNTSIPQ